MSKEKTTYVDNREEDEKFGIGRVLSSLLSFFGGGKNESEKRRRLQKEVAEIESQQGNRISQLTQRILYYDRSRGRGVKNAGGLLKPKPENQSKEMMNMNKEYEEYEGKEL